VSERRSALIEANRGDWPLSLEAYFRANAWRMSDRLSNAVVWTKSKGKGVGAEVIVPLSSSLPDFELRLNDALDTVARLDGISISELLSVARAEQWDTSKLRLIGPGFEEGTVALEVLANLLKGAKDAVLAAACSATQTRSYFPGRKPQIAEAHLARVRVAQTEVGSYVVNVQSPAGNAQSFEEQQPLSAHLAPMPFSRRSTVYLARAVGRLSSLVEGVTLRSDEVAEAVGVGLTVNLCDAVATMVPDSVDGELELGFLWATGVQPPSGIRGKVRFNQDKSAKVREISAQLKETIPRDVGIVAGPVVTLHRPTGSLEGIATIEAAVDGRARRVRVVLPPGSYHAAIQAHGAQQRVHFEGRIVRYGRLWFLERPSQVVSPRLLPDASTANAG
jgi:hypothetical protein